MFLIGQTLNSSDPAVCAAMSGGDFEWLRAVAARQFAAGVDTIDVNAGALAEDEGAVMRWLLPLLENSNDKALSIDSADPGLLLELGASCRLPPLLNSFALDDPWPPALTELSSTGARFVCQMRCADWLPSSCDERLHCAELWFERLARHAIPASHVFLDPVLLPWGEDFAAGRALLDFMERFDELPTLVGLSNVSFGWRQRQRANRMWLSELKERGLSAVILDPFDPALMLAAR